MWKSVEIYTLSSMIFMIMQSWINTHSETSIKERWRSCNLLLWNYCENITIFCMVCVIVCNSKRSLIVAKPEQILFSLLYFLIGNVNYVAVLRNTAITHFWKGKSLAEARNCVMIFHFPRNQQESSERNAVSQAYF